MSADAGIADGALGITLELQGIRYDGQDLFGRLLISPKEGPIRFDKRLIESIALSMEDVRDCATGLSLDYLVVDVLAPRPREEHLLTLQPGYWYGKDIRIPLFDMRLSEQQSPDCVDVRIAFHALQKPPFPILQVRALRTEQPAPDSGTTTPLSTPDAGAGVTGP